MPFRLLERYCIHTILLLRGPSGDEGTGLGDYGEILEDATPVTLSLKARVEWTNDRIIDDTGEEVICAARIFIPPTYPDPITGAETELTIGPQDRIVVEHQPDRVLAMARRNFEEGWEDDRGRHWMIWVR